MARSTDTPTLGFSNFLSPSSLSKKYTYPTPGNYSSEIKGLEKGLSLDHMKDFLKEFTSFRTRYYRSETGKQSQQFLMKTIKEVRCRCRTMYTQLICQISKDNKHVSIKEFPHSWGQNSIVVRFSPRSSKNDVEPVVIIGAHQDSTNQWPFLPAP
jgi:leucyl aminopeptidase